MPLSKKGRFSRQYTVVIDLSAQTRCTRGDELFRIIIAGGGIAGLAAAIALRGANREIIVLEQSSMNKEVGALISLQPNASKIASGLGLDPFLADKGPMIDRAFRIFNTAGELQKTVELKTETYGADRTVYHRQDLHESLKEAAISSKLSGLPAEIRVSSRVRCCDCEEGIVTLEDGDILKADLIVGADGIHSVVRNHVAGAKEYAKTTGLSAYRLLFSSDDLRRVPGLDQIIDPASPLTTMMFGYNCRLVMGPARNGNLYGLVALVPDEYMHEKVTGNSWTTPGSVEKLLESFDNFPMPIKDLLRTVGSVALWQLRDIDPLETWVKGRTILIGDAAHAMLPLQGQGASQSFEDAEALQAFFADVQGRPSAEEINRRLQEVFVARFARASLIQGYSRQQAKPATDKEGMKLKLTMTEFMDYNCRYSGAKDWQRRQQDMSAS